jgi:hypothetical protein
LHFQNYRVTNFDQELPPTQRNIKPTKGTKQKHLSVF